MTCGWFACVGEETYQCQALRMCLDERPGANDPPLLTAHKTKHRMDDSNAFTCHLFLIRKGLLPICQQKMPGRCKGVQRTPADDSLYRRDELRAAFPWRVLCQLPSLTDISPRDRLPSWKLTQNLRSRRIRRSIVERPQSQLGPDH